MTPDTKMDCEARIATMFNKRHSVLTANGTSALTIALRLASPDKPRVLLPAMACFNTVMAICFAGKIPVFADVLENDATIDPVWVKRAITADPDIGAVLIVHLYGHPARTEEIIRICREHHVVPIEDPAQAMGGSYPTGEPLGALGDMSIASFGHTKILDAGGGGALLTDDPVYHAQARELEKGLPTRSEKAEALEAVYRPLYYAIWAAGKLDERFFALFDDLPMKFRDLFLYRLSDNVADRVNPLLDRLETVVSDRRGVGDIYRSELCGVDGVHFFSPRQGNVPWRFTFRMDPCIRDDVLERMRQNAFDISAWYPCFTQWTRSGRRQGRGAFPVAAKLEKEVVNLWVAEGYTPERAIETARALTSEIAKALGHSECRR